jgi:hypothetical protein
MMILPCGLADTRPFCCGLGVIKMGKFVGWGKEKRQGKRNVRG